MDKIIAKQIDGQNRDNEKKNLQTEGQIQTRTRWTDLERDSNKVTRAKLP